MQGMMKRVIDFVSGNGPHLSKTPKNTADAELSPPSAETDAGATWVAWPSDIAPTDRENRVSGDIETVTERSPTLAEVNTVRIALAQRIKVEDTRRSRSANVMRRASDMLGYLSRELTAQDRRLFEVKAELDREISNGDGDAAEVERIGALLIAANARIDGYAAEVEDLRAARDTMTELAEERTAERDEMERRANMFRDAITDNAGVLSATAIERDTARALAVLFRETLVDVRDRIKPHDLNFTISIIDAALATETMTGKSLAEKVAAKDGFDAFDVLTALSDTDRLQMPRLEDRLAWQFTLAREGYARLFEEHAEALAKVAALSQPRIVNVAGLVDADLAERYESLRQSFDRVSTYSGDKLKDCEDALLSIVRQVGTVGLTLENGEGPLKRGVVVETILRRAGLRTKMEAVTANERAANAAVNERGSGITA